MTGAADLGRRVAAIEGVARGLSREQILAFHDAVKAAPAAARWPEREPFWFQGTANLKLSHDEQAALAHLWTRLLAGLAYAVTHEDVEAWEGRSTLMGRLDRLVEPRQSRRIEGRATTVIERTLGGNPWQGVIGIWNACCGTLLRERLDPSLRSDLLRAWRAVIGGEVPR